MAKRGNCYHASEALWHILGGQKSGWKPEYVKMPTDTHWFLRHPVFGILDPSRLQFKVGEEIPYWKGRGCGFLTKKPSKAAQRLIEALTWQVI